MADREFDPPFPRRGALFYLAITGLIVAQITWALNYWNISNWSGGMLLVTVFYVISGLAQQYFQEKLNRFVLIEFAVTATVALVGCSPWSIVTTTTWLAPATAIVASASAIESMPPEQPTP